MNTGLADGRATGRGEVAGESIIGQAVGLDLERGGLGKAAQACEEGHEAVL